MAKATANLRVDFSNAPPSVLKALYGEAKDKQAIFMAISEIGEIQPDKKTPANPNVHYTEIFHYINTDTDGEWILNESGEPAIGLQSLQRQLGALVDTGQLVRSGERTGRFRLADGVEIETDDAE